MKKEARAHCRHIWVWVRLVGGARPRPRGAITHSERCLYSTSNSCTRRTREQQREHRRRKFKTWETEEAAEKEKSKSLLCRRRLTCPFHQARCPFSGNLHATHAHQSFAKPLILALFFRFKTKVRIINSLKSFKVPAPSIRGPSGCPGG